MAVCTLARKMQSVKVRGDEFMSNDGDSAASRDARNALASGGPAMTDAGRREVIRTWGYDPNEAPAFSTSVNNSPGQDTGSSHSADLPMWLAVPILLVILGGLGWFFVAWWGWAHPIPVGETPEGMKQNDVFFALAETLKRDWAPPPYATTDGAYQKQKAATSAAHPELMKLFAAYEQKATPYWSKVSDAQTVAMHLRLNDMDSYVCPRWQALWSLATALATEGDRGIHNALRASVPEYTYVSEQCVRLTR